ncbi:5-formyltetrahydrofolate cyclo-ligase [Desulfurobacterium indicum]|uniref:5-formyltetrahydrofolate cyclo-ligase n=1 Tax=Desulfurobacterium indicum TaxID=1914305 RepID=A0A1R1MM78_9BACT|nr:5-formyltetrahydrofolate cyclo-ligase [Desulfurobacterium indicum]OMH40804.1 5-formyltetrahydrofolate cyclo-ligase [Desulfurobacterium indicum]
MKEKKAKLRHRIREKRLLLSAKEIEEKSRLICEKILNLQIVKENSSFLLYYPFKNEVSLLPLFDALKKAGKSVSFPKVSGKEIVPVKVNSLNELYPGYMGILEPKETANTEKPSVVFVPGIAFDLKCYRLGYGGGFYDRFLSGGEYTTVGVCFDFQIVKNLPVEPFDVPVNLVVSEKRTIRRKEWNY